MYVDPNESADLAAPPKRQKVVKRVVFAANNAPSNVSCNLPLLGSTNDVDPQEVLSSLKDQLKAIFKTAQAAPKPHEIPTVVFKTPKRTPNNVNGRNSNDITFPEFLLK